MSDAHQEGHAWGDDMAIICRDYATMDECASALSHRRLPHQVRKRTGDYKPNRDAINVLTMRVSKGSGVSGGDAALRRADAGCGASCDQTNGLHLRWTNL